MEPIHVETSNPSHNLQDPSKLLSNAPVGHDTSNGGQIDVVSDQGLSALHSQQPTDVKQQAKGTLQNISSLTDAAGTTMGDSALQLPSQNISHPGTLNTIDNLANYEKPGEEGLQDPDKLSTETPAMKLIRLSESPPQSALPKKAAELETEHQMPGRTSAEQEVKEKLTKDPVEDQGVVGSVPNESDQSSALVSQQENIKTENTRQVKIESPDSKKQLERVTSLEKLTNQTENNPVTMTPAQTRSETDHSESQSLGTPFKVAGSDQQFTSDQHDSEGYSSRNRAGSSKNESGLSSTEENKVQEAAKKDTGPIAKPKISLADFHKVAVLGRGSYGEVSLVKKISNNKLYALKTVDKYFMKKEKKEHQVYVEKEVLMKSNHPNIIKFYSSFQDKKKLYFVLEYVGGGEFSDYLRAQRKLRKEETAFFTAEVINILEYLHSNNIAHRDIKPENLLLTTDGHLKCIDFGTAQFLTEAKAHKEESQSTEKAQNPEEQEPVRKDSNEPLSHRKTFVGTAQYVSPEMLEHSECDAAADLWALGCMVYVMSVGRYPFEESNEFLIFQKIQNLDISYPIDMDPEIKDLIEKLLKKDPRERLGAGPKGSANDFAALKAHPLFTGIDFAKLHKAKAPMAEIVSPHRQKDQFVSFSSPIEDPIQKLVPNRKHFLSEDLQTLDEKTGKVPAQSTSSTAEVKERIILSGLVMKKCGWLFFRPRQLVLNSKPRLVYYDPETNQIKGEIPFEPGTVAELESKTKWIIHTPKKKYYFKEMEHSAEKWVETINKVAAQLNQKKV